MKLIVGLGNPGEEYKNTRHNIGYLLVDFLRPKKLSQVVTKKTGVFMNKSGEAVKKFVGEYQLKAEDLYIAYDDLDIKLGEYKIQRSKGPKDHKGLNSIYKHLDDKDFWHVRIGVDNRDPEDRVLGEDYVLQNFEQNELEIVKEVLNKVINDLLEKINA